jgi:hypothetical protein
VVETDPKPFPDLKKNVPAIVSATGKPVWLFYVRFGSGLMTRGLRTAGRNYGCGLSGKGKTLISRRAFLLASLTPLLLSALPAAAQDGCGSGEDIVALADYVLANRVKLAKTQNRRKGAIAAFLKIRYQKLSAPADIDAIVGPLITANVDRARELLYSWRISTLGLEATLAAESPQAQTDVLSLNTGSSVLRAGILSGELAVLFDRIAALPEPVRQDLELRAVKATLDLADESAIEIAAEASARKLDILAGGLIAAHGEQSAWLEFIGKLGDKAKADTLTALLATIPALRGRPGLPRPPEAEPQSEISRSLVHQTIIAAAATPEQDYLLPYFNRTGDLAALGAASSMIIDLVRDDAAIEMETIWLVAYEALKSVATAKDGLDAALEAISMQGPTRFGSASVRDALDTMLAIETFKTSAAGAGSPAEMVMGASKEFLVQLPAWREATEAIARGADLAPFRSSGQKLGIVANLLFANGRFADLTKFLTGTVPNSDSIRLAEIYAEALDRRCSAMLAFPAEAVTMPGLPLFRFED